MSGQSDAGGSSARPRSGGQPTPHDSVFRRIFGVPENAASQLRAVRPAELVARLDLSRLTPVPASFVDETLRWRHSDLLFSAPLDGRDAYVYLLVEHQSSTDPLMAFRMLQYVTRIWDQHLRDHEQARMLPAVIPLVVHHGRTPWDRPVQLLDLVDLDPDAKQATDPYLPRFEFLLDDLTDVDAEQLRDRGLTPSALITLLLLKTAAGNPEVSSLLRPWASQLRAVLDQAGGGEVFIAILTYIELVSETPTKELEDLAASLGPDAEEGYMTTADMLRTEGRAEGRAQGRAEALKQVLTARFGAFPDNVAQMVLQASSEQLQAWTARALTVETLDQVFD